MVTKPLYLAAAVMALAPLVLGAKPPPRLDEALAAQRALVEQNPASASALSDLGNLLVVSGDRQAAEEVYRRAIETAPDRPEPRFNLALLLQEAGRWRPALRQLKQLLREHPDHAWAHYQLGTVQAGRGNRGSALRSFSKAFRLDPRLTDPRVNPHIVDNALTTAAMLRAFSAISPAAAAPRIYAEPSHITDLLLPRLTEPAAAAPEPAPAAPEEEASGEEDG